MISMFNTNFSLALGTNKKKQQQKNHTKLIHTHPFKSDQSALCFCFVAALLKKYSAENRLLCNHILAQC